MPQRQADKAEAHRDYAATTMTSRELEALQNIERAGGRAHAHSVADKMGISVEYTRDICASLYRRNYVEKVQPGWYRITREGKQCLLDRGFEVSIPVRQLERKEPMVAEAPRDAVTSVRDVAKELAQELRSALGVPQRSEIQIKSSFSPELERVKLKHNLKPSDEVASYDETVEDAADTLKKLRT